MQMCYPIEMRRKRGKAGYLTICPTTATYCDKADFIGTNESVSHERCGNTAADLCAHAAPAAVAAVAQAYFYLSISVIGACSISHVTLSTRNRFSALFNSSRGSRAALALLC